MAATVIANREPTHGMKAAIPIGRRKAGSYPGSSA